MSKYHLESKDSTDKELYLEFIANELAEANRLKRIEIKHSYIEGDSEFDDNDINTLLEDEA